MKNILTFILGLLMLLCCIDIFAQDEKQSLKANFIETPIILDGELTETEWQKAESADNFWQYFPKDSVREEQKTEVKVLHDDEFLYIGIKAYSENKDYVVSTLKRDFGGATNDNITLLFDTFNDGTTAYAFGVTPYGVRREILISEGGSVRTGFNINWDVKWKAESKIYDDRYEVEVAIPFYSLKFLEGATSWRFRSYRWNIQTNEQTTWVRVPQNQFLANLAFMGELQFEKPLGKSKTPISLIPYVNTIAQKNYVDNETDRGIEVGGDAKFAIGDGLNLDLTINPDFSNVEVDDIFTNLTRFELRLPEKRQFFIDNSDLFASYGNTFSEAKPFFSRRIGLSKDTLGNLIQNKIIGGARLSGKLNKNLRLGVLNIQTAEDEINEIASFNNSMIALQQKVFARSNIGAFFINKQTLSDAAYIEADEKYNRVVGLDYNLASKNNAWSGRYYIHKSLQEGDNTGNLSSQVMLRYNKESWQFLTDYTFVDGDFRADLGFVPRTDIFKTGQAVWKSFFLKDNNFISRHTIRLLSKNYWKPSDDFRYTDYENSINWQINFSNQAVFIVDVERNYIYLTSEFDPTRKENGTPLPANEKYYFNALTLDYKSGPTKLFTYGVNTTIGQFFNGKRYSVGINAGFRFQPWVQIAINASYDNISLPEPYESANYFLITPKIDISFSRTLFWNTLIQYSNQNENIGINSRLQWRFAPLSDLFLVYNDNYITTDFGPRFRSINLKLSYWLNL